MPRTELPELLVRVGEDGVCLDTVAFGELPDLPKLAGLRDRHVRDVLPPEFADLIRRWVDRPEPNWADEDEHEVDVARRRYLLTVRPGRQHTLWIRIQDVSALGQVDEEPHSGTPDRLDRWVAAAAAVSASVRDATHPDEVATNSLRAFCRALDWEVGILWWVGDERPELRCGAVVTEGAFPIPVSKDDESPTVTRGDGLAGDVWARAQAAWMTHGFDRHPVLHASPALSSLRSGFAFPIAGREGILGVMEFVTRRHAPRGDGVIRIAGIIGDHLGQVFHRVRSEELARHSEAQQAAILASSARCVVIVDGQRRIVAFNPEAEQTFGRPSAAVLGHDVTDLIVAGGDRDALQSALDGSSADTDIGPPERQLRVRAVHPEAGEFPAELSIVKIGASSPSRFSIGVRDLSDRQRLEAELRQAQRMESLGQLASGIAHNFNNFLTVIRGQSERLERSLEKDDRRRQWVASILRVSERARKLTGQLVTFGRREAHPVSVTDLNANIVSIGGLLEQLMGEKIELRLLLANDLWPMRIDDTHLEQILFNLAANARDAMRGEGALEIGTSNVMLGTEESGRLGVAAGPYVSLWVSDSGRGMDATTQNRVFEPFFTTKKKGQGTGIGLANVSGLVHQGKGQITVASELGRGTTFRIYLPMVERRRRSRDRRALGEAEKEPPAGRVELTGVTVLLAEDQHDVRGYYRQDLERVGCTVLEACSGPEALRVSSSHPGTIDVLVSDVVMPEMNGRDLARRLALVRPNVGVVLVSGHSASALAESGVNTSDLPILQKPVAGQALIDRVRSLCPVGSDGTATQTSPPGSS